MLILLPIYIYKSLENYEYIIIQKERSENEAKKIIMKIFITNIIIKMAKLCSEKHIDVWKPLQNALI